MITVDIIVEDARWDDDAKELCTKVAEMCMAAFERFDDSETEVVILLADDARLRRLNLQFRQKDAPTNVLSFPDDDYDGASQAHIGDIAISYDRVLSEFSQYRDTPREYLAFLVIHGMLHLFGFDHETSQEAQAEMEALEETLMDRCLSVSRNSMSLKRF